MAEKKKKEQEQIHNKNIKYLGINIIYVLLKKLQNSDGHERWF